MSVQQTSIAVTTVWSTFLNSFSVNFDLLHLKKRGRGDYLKNKIIQVFVFIF